MDMDAELEDFDKTGTPSLVGQSIRGELKENSTSTSRASSKPNFKVSRSPEESITSLEQLQLEGVLLQDEEDLENILDKEGHIKDAALDITEKENVEGGDALKPPSSIDIKSINASEERDSFIANDQEFIAPASSRDGSKSRSSSAKPRHFSHIRDDNRPVKRSPLTETTTSSVDNILEQEEAEPSITDVVNEYNEGKYDMDKKDESDAEERKPRKPTRTFEDPQIPDSAIAIDSEFTVPAGAKEGSDSPFIASPERLTTSNSKGEYVQSPQRPHLARGDSYQNTVTNNDFSSTPPLNLGGRKSRTSNRSESSINYLRSISRSRSRVANDRHAMGEDRGIDEQELKEEGALVGDNYDQQPDLEDAMSRALDKVQEELKSLMFDQDDILEEVDEDSELRDKAIEPESKEIEPVEKSIEETGTVGLISATDDATKEAEEEPLVIDLELKEDESSETVRSESIATEEEKEEPSPEKEEISEEPEVEKLDTEEVIEKVPISEPVEKKEVEEEPSVEEEDSKVEEPTVEKEASEVTEEPASKSVDEEQASVEEPVSETIEEPAVEESEPSVEEKTVEEPTTEKIAEESKPSVEEDKVEEPVEDNAVEESSLKEPAAEKESSEQPTEEPELEESAAKEEETEEPVSETVEESLQEKSEEPAVAKEVVSEEPLEAKKSEASAVSEEIEKLLGGETPTESTEAAEESVADAPPSETETDVTSSTPLTEKEVEEEVLTPEEDPVEAESTSKSLDEEKELPIEDETKLEPVVEKEVEPVPLKRGHDGSVYVPKASDKMTYEDEPVYLYTSFAGGNLVATRTNRMITILTANKVEFTMRDLGTDVEAKKVWRRYSSGKTLPGIVRGKDDFIGNWEEIEEANENYEVRSLIYETA